MIDSREVTGGPPVAVDLHPLVDCRQIVEHAIRLLAVIFEKAEHVDKTIFRDPKRGDRIMSLFGHCSRTQLPGNLLVRGLGDGHISSTPRSTEAFCLSGRTRSRMEMIGARWVV